MQTFSSWDTNTTVGRSKKQFWVKNTHFQRGSHNPWEKIGNFNLNSNFSQGHCNLHTFTPTAHPVLAKLNFKLQVNCYLHLNMLRNFQIKFVENWISWKHCNDCKSGPSKVTVSSSDFWIGKLLDKMLSLVSQSKSHDNLITCWKWSDT